MVVVLYMEMVIFNFIIYEYYINVMKVFIWEFCIYDYQLENGYYIVLEQFGLGQELNDEVVKEYLVYVIKQYLVILIMVYVFWYIF